MSDTCPSTFLSTTLPVALFVALISGAVFYDRGYQKADAKGKASLATARKRREYWNAPQWRPGGDPKRKKR